MAANNNETHLIRLLNINDVLLGRGGPNKFIGNVRFRELVKSRKEEYNSYDSYNEKKRIATEGVFDVISFRGGRFLSLVRIENIPGLPPRSAIEAGVWEVVERKVALEKCKQALREKEHKPKEGGKTKTTQQENDGIEYPPNHLAGALEAHPAAATFPVPPAAAAAPPNISSASNAVSAALLTRPASLGVDPRLYLCQQSLLSLQQQSLIQQQQQLAPSYPLQLNLNLQASPTIASGVSHAQLLQNMILQSQLRALMTQTAAAGDSHDRDTAQQDEQETKPKHDSAASSSTASESDDREDAVFALSALAVADHPQFTEEQEQIEQSQMSSDERVAALCDLFGKCTLAGTHPNKKAKRDLDRESLDFLVAQMRLELELIPANKKEAFMEARAKCRPEEEFCDARLERFLRCEGMNTKVSYSHSPM
jgi:hypothetical protein